MTIKCSYFPFAGLKSALFWWAWATCGSTVLTKWHAGSVSTLPNNSTFFENMSTFGGESAVEIDQEFFDSGYSYNSQAQSSNYYEPNEQQQPPNQSEYTQSYSQYGQTQPTTGYSSYTSSSYSSNTSFYNPQTYDYGASGPTAMNEPSFSGFMQPKQTSEDYTSFEDEPPLLEGNLKVQSRKLIFIVTASLTLYISSASSRYGIHELKFELKFFLDCFWR